MLEQLIERILPTIIAALELMGIYTSSCVGSVRCV